LSRAVVVEVAVEAGLSPCHAVPCTGILGVFIAKNNLVFLALKENIF
jgi:hypothetical protein